MSEVPALPEALAARFAAVTGFMPDDEGAALHAAAVLLAADALAGHSAGHAVFRGHELPSLWTMIDCDEHCYERVGSVLGEQ